MRELVVEAERQNLPKVQGFIDEMLEAAGCPTLTQTAIDVAVEEIFVNIACYAYSPETGIVLIQAAVCGQPPLAEIAFTDSGRPYNPLAKPDPDTSLSVRQRKKGGLGIFMVKQSMDRVNYEYRDGKNILTISKLLGEDG